MSDFQPVRKHGGKGPSTTNNNNSSSNSSSHSTIKYPSQHQQLVEMGFESSRVQKILEQTRGDLEKATSMLLGEDSHSASHEETFQEKKNESARGGVRGKQQQSHTTTAPVVNVPAAVLPSNNSKEVTESHKKMMATYKVHKCKDINNLSHDRKMCMYWHTASDRRRNPFDFSYSCYECPNVVGGSDCKNGDKCNHAHNMLERMFHPELFKISMCQRSQEGRKCDRGILCAFAHSDADLRVSPSKLDPSLADKPPAKPVTSDIIIPEDVRDRVLQLIRDAGSEGIYSLEMHKKYQHKYDEPLDFSEDKYGAKFKLKELLESHPDISLVYPRGNQPVYVIVDGESKEESGETNNASDASTSLETIRERLTEVIKNCGTEGVLGSDLPKKYLELYGEKLDFADESGSKLKLKDMLQSQPGIVAKLTKFQQPRYCFEATNQNNSNNNNNTVESKLATGKISYSAIASAAAEKEKAKVGPPPAVQTSKQFKQKAKEGIAPAPVSNLISSAPSGSKSFAEIVAAKAHAADLALSDGIVSDSPVPTEEFLDNTIESQPADSAAEDNRVQLDVVVQSEFISQPPSLSMSIDLSSMSKLVPSVSITESPVSLPPSVFPVGDATPGRDLLLFGIDSKANESMDHQSKFHELLYNMKPNGGASFSVPLSPERDHKRNDHSLMPPGLTKQSKGDVNTSLLSQSIVSDDTARKLTQAQNQVSSMQDQINNLQKELSSKKTEFDNQASQLKTTQQKLKEAEAKSSLDSEPIKAQLKAKDEELAMYLSHYQEEIKKIHQERLSELTQISQFFHQIEYSIQHLKGDEVNPDVASKEDISALVRLLPSIKQFCGSCRQQLKFKSDQLQQTQRNQFDPYGALATAQRGYPMQYYDQQSYFPNQFYGNGYGAVPTTQQCAMPGCRQPGAFQCTNCYSVWYCSNEHQHLHYPQHVGSCGNL